MVVVDIQFTANDAALKFEAAFILEPLSSFARKYFVLKIF